MKPKKKKPNKPIIHKKHKENPVVVRPKTKHYRANKQSVGSVIHKDHVERNKETPECKHNWIPLIGRVGNKDVPTALFTCMKCGEMKVGTNTIRISRYRLDMGGHPLYAGDVVLGENAGLTLDTALSADGKYCGIVEDGTAGATLAFGDLCYFITASSKWGLAKADSTTTSGDVKLGICVLAGNDTQATKMLLYGKIRADAKFPTLTISAPVYVSGANAGAITTTAPSESYQVIKKIGFGNTADELFFYPSLDYFTHTFVPAWLGARGVIGGSQTTSSVKINTIEYITIATTGNSTDFGDCAAGGYSGAVVARGGCSNKTRGIFYAGIDTASNQKYIEYITIATTGNATTFGDALTACRGLSGVSDGSRGCFAGSSHDYTNVIEYITIASTGNGADFGDLTVQRISVAAFNDSTRGVWCQGGINGSPWSSNVIDYNTIQTTGNSTDFGDCTPASYGPAGCGSDLRGLVSGNSSAYSNVINYITIAVTGNSTDFGDLTVGRAPVATSDNIRGVIMGGDNGSVLNVIDYITISTIGNATDFGDLITPMQYGCAFSGS